MRFVVKGAVLSRKPPDEVLHALDALLRRVELGVHELVVQDADRLAGSRWYQRSTQTGKNLLRQAAEAGIYAPPSRGPHRKEVEVASPEDAGRAERTALSPLVVLVEDERSDRVFLEEVAHHLADPTLKALWLPRVRAEPPALRVEGPGGNTKLAPAIDQRLGEALEADREPRLFVVSDSDAERPRELSNKAREIKARCQQKGVPCTILNKRTAENYLPDTLWELRRENTRHPALRDAIDALLRLRAEQRDHVRLGRGEPWSRDNDLFEAVPDADRQALRYNLKGKGDERIILVLGQRRQAISAADLRDRDGSNELDDLLQRIADEL